MAVWAPLAWLTKKFVREARAAQAMPTRLVQSSIDAVVDAVEPRLRVVDGYRDKLAPAVARSLAHIGSLVAQLPQPIEISRRAWTVDPLINALFAGAGDVTGTLGRSAVLRDFFGVNAGVANAFALLRATRSEREVLAPGMVGTSVRQDVAQVAVNFADFRFSAVAADAVACRRQVADWLLRRLATLALERIVADEARMVQRQERKALLAAHLRLHKLHAAENHPAADDGHVHDAEIARLEAELKDASAAEEPAPVVTLDARLRELDSVLAAAAKQLCLTSEEVRVNRLGMKVARGAEEPHATLTLHELAIGPDAGKEVVVLACCPRFEMPAPRGLPADAGKCGL